MKGIDTPEVNPAVNGCEVEEMRKLPIDCVVGMTAGEFASVEVATKSWLSVVSSAILPIASTTGAEPFGRNRLASEKFQIPKAVMVLSRMDISLVPILLTIWRMVVLAVPCTTSADDGVVVPIPTLPALVST